MPDSLCDLDADALSRMIHSRSVGCRETLEAFLDRIERLNPTYNAIVSLRDRDELLREADARDAMLARGESMGWLHGMPIAIKDLASTRGIRTTWGSPIFRDFVPDANSLPVERVRRAGAIVIGKTNTPEFGLGSQTYNRVFGVTRNAYDASRCAGGSSGGAAVALALRLLPIADGSDYGGSLRNPAAFNNVLGLRPSQGRVPAAPVDDAFVAQFSTDGPMARSVVDLARMLAIQSGYDRRAPLSLAVDDALSAALTQPAERWQTAAGGAGWRGCRIGWLGDYDGYLPTEPGVLEVCAGALGALRAIGCEVVPASLGFDPQRLWRAFVTLRQWLTAGRLRVHYDDPQRRPQLKPEAIWEIEHGLRLSAADVYSASQTRSRWYQQMLALFERHDFLALPSAQVFPFDAEQPWPKTIAGREMDSYHRWMEVTAAVTLSGCPALSMPAGFDPRGLPMGIQLVAPPRDEHSLLRLAHAYEQQTSWVKRRPPLP